MRSRLFAVLTAALVLWAAPAAAKTYAARQYDVRLEIQDDGSVRITETIVIRFDDGPFERFFREIPTRRMDGLEFESARIDGQALPWGDAVGQAELSGRSTRRVTWHFAPVEYAVREFTVVYRVRGLVRQSETADQILWRALPSEHDYVIDSSLITIRTGAALRGDPDVRTRRIGAISTVPDDRGLVVSAQDVGRNGWVEVHLTYPKGALVDAPPVWQQTRAAANASGPYWLGGAALVAVLALVPLVGLRAHYRAPPDEATRAEDVRDAPDDLSPALAGVMMSAGKATGAHALSILFDLANRGAITITETEKRSLGQRRFEVRREQGNVPLNAEERLVLDTAFRKKGRTESTVRLADAAGRLRSQTTPLQDLMRETIERRGFWDRDRAANRKRLFAWASLWLILAGLWAPVGLLLLGDFLAWPLLLSAGLVVAGLICLAVAGSRTPLSNEGVRRATRWQSYATHLKAVARGKASPGGQSAMGLLPTAVALGLAADWARYLKKHPGQLPAWFHAASEGGSAAVAALVAAVSTSSGGAGGAGAAGGAAGGGASGAG